MLLNVGLHGTNFDDDNCWSHWDAPGAVAYGLSARLAGVPVFLLQGAGGDTSPSGRGATAMTKVDDLAQRAGARLAPLVEATQTSGEPIALDLAHLSMEQSHQAFRVVRRGTTEFHYAPVTLDEYGQPTETPDNQIYDAQGAVIKAIDEFLCRWVRVSAVRRSASPSARSGWVSRASSPTIAAPSSTS